MAVQQSAELAQDPGVGPAAPRAPRAPGVPEAARAPRAASDRVPRLRLPVPAAGTGLQGRAGEPARGQRRLDRRRAVRGDALPVRLCRLVERDPRSGAAAARGGPRQAPGRARGLGAARRRHARPGRNAREHGSGGLDAASPRYADEQGRRTAVHADVPEHGGRCARDRGLRDAARARVLRRRARASR